MTNDIKIVKGKTFRDVIRWESAPVIYKAITGIAKTAPVRIIAIAHGIPDGWRAAVTNAGGMTEINAVANNLRDSDYKQVTVVDVDTVDLNAVNAAGFRAYTSGGYIQYNTPVDLTGFTARQAIKARVAAPVLLQCSVAGISGTTKPTSSGVDGTVTWESVTSGVADYEWRAGTAYDVSDVVDLTHLLYLTTENGRLILDTANFKITRDISAADTAMIDWKKGVFDLELVSPDAEPVVTGLVSGTAFVSEELTV